MIHVLVVDDDAALVRAHRRVLVRKGFVVSVATSLEHARSCLRGNPPDAVVCDHVLPDGQGVDFLRELRGRHPDMALILATGDLLVASEFPTVFKPFDFAQLRQVILEELPVGSMVR